MDEPAYHAGMRELQDRFDTRRLADRLDAPRGPRNREAVELGAQSTEDGAHPAADAPPRPTGRR